MALSQLYGISPTRGCVPHRSSPFRALRADAQCSNRAAVSIAILKASGLFRCGQDNTSGFSVNGLQLLATYLDSSDRVLLQYELADGLYGQQVELAFVRLKFGSRRYFICPYTGRRCRELVFGERGFTSLAATKLPGRQSLTQRRHDALRRKLERLDGTDGRGPARGHKRAQIVRSIEPSLIMHLAAPGIAMKLDAERDKLLRPQRSALRCLTRADNLTTAAGLKNSQLVRVDRGSREVGEDDAAASERLRKGPRSLSPAFVEEFPVLDIGVLGKRGMLVPGGVRARTIEWAGHDNIILECRLDDSTNPVIFVRSRYHIDRQHLIRLVQNDRGRWYMLCPFTGIRSTILFLRDGIFGSRRGNNLIHRSQRANSQRAPK